MSDAGHPFPLYWPEGRPRTQRRGHSKYKTNFAAARDAVLRRLRSMGASNVVISSNVPLRRDGLPLAGGADQLQDPGIAVYFTRRKRDHVIACDRWFGVSENMRAIGATLDALATIERSGSEQLADQAYAGFARLPAQAGPSGVAHWSAVLGVAAVYEDACKRNGLPLPQQVRSALLTASEYAFRDLAKQHHPDVRGGSHEAMSELNRAIQEARRELT